MPGCTPPTAPSSLIDVLDAQVLVISSLLRFLLLAAEFVLDAEDLIYIFNDCMTVLEKLIQFNLLCRFEVFRNSFPASFETLIVIIIIICVLLALLEGYADEACGGCRLLKDRLLTMILVFLKDSRLYILFFNSKGP